MHTLTDGIPGRSPAGRIHGRTWPTPDIILDPRNEGRQTPHRLAERARFSRGAAAVLKGGCLFISTARNASVETVWRRHGGPERRAGNGGSDGRGLRSDDCCRERIGNTGHGGTGVNDRRRSMKLSPNWPLKLPVQLMNNRANVRGSNAVSAGVRWATYLRNVPQGRA